MAHKKTNYHTQQQRPDRQGSVTYVANVPVRITIEYKDAVLDRYEDVVDIEMSEQTPESKQNILTFLFLTRKKGFSTEEALFTIASEAVKDAILQDISTLGVLSHSELHIHVQRDGAIKYTKSV